ncbi:sensor histidine kinase [Daejeonella oryzae]|uniref:sensor histidine kinase n=1 Tax=Daejeonella oryzae TaxID=1122943 RepID=UPI0004224803|nr:histidine kinase [Daejeonella oryzae]
MNDLTKKPLNLNRIEFWAATTMYVFAVFFLVAKGTQSNINIDGIPTPFKYGFEENRSEYSFYSNYFFPQIVRYTTFYGSFLLLNFLIIPAFIKRQSLLTNILLSILLFFAIGLTLGVADTYLKTYLLAELKSDQAGYNYIFQQSFAYSCWLMLMFGFYTVIKYAAQYLLMNSELIQAKYEIVTREGLIAFVLWMISVFLLLIGNAADEIIAVWAVVFPFAIGLYWYSFHVFIPRALEKKNPFRNYLGKIFLVVLLSVLPVSLLSLIMFNHSGEVAVVNLFNAGFQLLITAPVGWVIYKRRIAGNQEVFTLQTALGHSNANLDFLRSQINPHFLFNALNTLYGTALHENADRTGEGIQKLGEMMRFMLQENIQEKISLAREVEYLNNYIGLQKLRTDISSNIQIESIIEEQVSNLQISPMMLIPFVENAFKHGISLREPSHIRITLQTKGDTLFFDVQNSIHLKPDNDPEKNKSGIGLNNIKQRLQLLYPKKHELMIRETGSEFFVHLTLQLN